MSLPTLYHAEFSILYLDSKPVSLVFGPVWNPEVTAYTNEAYRAAYWKYANV